MKRIYLALAILLSLCWQASLAQSVNFPGIPDVPLKPGLSYGGFFKQHQPVKILFAVGRPGLQLKESLTNAALVINYLKAKGYKYKIHFVLYGKAVLAADVFNQKYSNWTPLLEDLHKQGVTFTVCHNSMVFLQVKSADVYPFMKVIPAGILSVAEYEMKGYSPIFNSNSDAE